MNVVQRRTGWLLQPRIRVFRAGRRTNLALLALLPLELGTGAAAFAIGSGWARWIVVAHGVVGVSVVVLGPWKTAISARGLRLRPPSRTWVSSLLGLLILAVIVTGFGHSTGLLRSLGPVSAMQVHVACALAAIPLALRHVMARPVRPRRTDLSRRSFVRSSLLIGASSLTYGILGGVGHAAGLPGAGRRFTGSFEKASFDPGRMPVTQWLRDPVPEIDPSRWRLSVSSADSTRSWSLEELTMFEDHLDATLDCTGGWYSTQAWEGVFLTRLVRELGSAESLEVRSATGYARRFPASDANRLLLATRLGGHPLEPGHGAPARIVAPGRRGFWWVKWVTDVSAGRTPWWWQPPFPLS